MKKTILAFAAFLVATLGMGAIYGASFRDAIVTGQGSLIGNIGETGFGTNQDAALQVSRNAGDAGGQGQGAAIDVYSEVAVGAYLQRWWINNAAITGGKAVATMIDSNGAIRTSTDILVSGLVTNSGGTAAQDLPLSPTSDSYMFGVASDVAAPAMYVSVCPTGSGCAAASAGAQAFVAMDGTQPVGSANVRFAIDGQTGMLRWTNSTANTFATATWDTQIGRVSAGILGDATTQLQTIHLDQPSSKHDLAGTIALSAVTSASFTFGTAYTSAPICTLTPTSDPGTKTWWVTATTTAVTAHVSASATITFNYHCVGNPN